MPDAPSIENIPEVGELDELETFVGSNKKKLNLVVDSSRPFPPRNFSLSTGRP
ncbi:hypothetical protein RintRC_0951 [Richelia intracellularis]|nr:hypothetical protein RintRC_0951 [Richelia intracellularis]